MQLIHGDMMQELPKLIADGWRANCVCTDPPYKLTSGGKNGGGMSGGWMTDYDNGGSPVDCDIDWKDFMPLLFASMDRGHAYIMANNRNVHPMLNAAEAAGFGFHNILVWNKRSATANRWYMKNLEFVGFFFKGNAFPINNCSSNQYIEMPQRDESNHPTEKPIDLMAHYIGNSTQPGEVVLDPFLGSGTTGVAARQLGRDFVGIESNEKHFHAAEKRISSALLQERLVMDQSDKGRPSGFTF